MSIYVSMLGCDSITDYNSKHLTVLVVPYLLVVIPLQINILNFKSSACRTEVVIPLQITILNITQQGGGVLVGVVIP